MPITGLSLGHGASGVSAPFSDGMVLQHKHPALFGLAKAGAAVTVHYDNHAYTAVANPDPWNVPLAPLSANSWRVELPAQPPGATVGNITVTCDGCASNTSSVVLSGCLFGDVYICSGQSNMELPLQSTFSWHSDFEANDTWSLAHGGVNIANDTEYPIRTLQLGHHLQLRENHSFATPAPRWQEPTSDGLKAFSAVCWYFGRALYNLQDEQQKVPVGLIEASWGGTIIEAWMPVDDQTACTNRYCESYVEGNGVSAGKCNRSDISAPNEQPGSLWNGEIVPLTNLTISGALWYQVGALAPVQFISIPPNHSYLPTTRRAKTTARTLVARWRAKATPACCQP